MQYLHAAIGITVVVTAASLFIVT